MNKAQITPPAGARPEGIKCAPTDARWKEVRLQERPPSRADKGSWRERPPAESWRALGEGSVGVQGWQLLSEWSLQVWCAQVLVVLGSPAAVCF